MREVLDAMGACRVFASIDLHINTGLDPCYACLTRLDPAFLQFASLCSRTVVRFRVPLGVQTTAFAAPCPSVTCECGQPGDAAGALAACDFLDAALHLDASFDGRDVALRFVPDLDHFNFREVAAGTLPGWARQAARREVIDDQGADVSGSLLSTEGGTVRLARPLMPAMLKRDLAVARQDCLRYLMERLPLP
jgi:hypothetical protein